MSLQKIGKIDGFNLIEVLIVGIILTIAMIAVFQMYSFSLIQIPIISNLMQANHLLMKEAEIINSKSYTEIDSFLSSNYPKIVKVGGSTYTISYSLFSYTWCKLIVYRVYWKDGKIEKNLSLELLRAKP
ncbi:MAG: hypothetical protein CBR30_08375 [Dictyoglomus sp. NZ13-RE01]|nr:MAG: hypothetical protein CBR30_08375 [Dictyoglomus sp. NZ13-RE01]